MNYKVEALISAQIGRKGFRQFPLRRVEAFTVDTAMDTDADQFSIDIGAPDHDLGVLFKRDTEVRANIYLLLGKNRIEQLHTGIADVCEYSSDDQIVSIAGRDFSSVAADSQAPPNEWKIIAPDKFVSKEARDLGITKLRLQKVTALTKFYRDGSETYWESWYRMYRKRGMWMWFEPDGTLWADKLNYAASPTYYIGWPLRGQGGLNWMPPTSVTITKDTQQRVGRVWIYGERGDIGFVSQQDDPTMTKWKKRPLRILTSTDAQTKDEARKEAWEEIFEGKVGELEISVTIPLSQSNRLLRQNTMAKVNIPAAGISGIFFVVGVQLQSGDSGYVQTVRLREKAYAISRRLPDDPQLEEDETADRTLPGSVGATLRSEGIRWANSFASAAQEFHGPWPFDLFLGVLLSICQQETGFRNVRESGDIEWYPNPRGVAGDVHGENSYENWKRNFANDPGSPGNPFSRDAGVGPFQLTSHDYKVWADEYGHKHDEYEGGRWMPQANIRAAARVLRSKLSGVDPSNANNIWIGVQAYNGSGPDAERYMRNVKRIYTTQFEGKTTDILDSGQQLPAGTGTTVTVKDAMGDDFTVEIPKSAPETVKKAINYALRQVGKPYQWGAVGPSSFDCSGLVWAAYNGAGFKHSRGTTYTYAKMGSAVTKDRLQAGDLVFFAKGSDIHHMGIYLNDGHFIHAPHTGDVVKISPLNSPYYRDQWWGARRLVDWSIPSLDDYPR